MVSSLFCGDVLVVSGNEATYVLKHNSYELVYTLPTASQAFSFSPNSRFLAVSASDSASVTIFDFATRDDSVVPPLPLAITVAVAGGGSSSVDNDTLTQHATADVVSNACTDDGRFVLVADSLGCIRTSDTSEILLNYGSPITLHTLSFPFLSSSVTKEDDAVVASDAAEERQVDLVAGSSGYVDREAKEEEDEDGAGEFNLAATKAQHGFEDGADGLRTQGPERVGSSDQGVDIELVEKIVNDKLRDANNDALKLVKARLGLIEPQAPFQSGSTEDTSKKQTRRYLCWNAIGTVSFFRSGRHIRGSAIRRYVARCRQAHPRPVFHDGGTWPRRLRLRKPFHLRDFSGRGVLQGTRGVRSCRQSGRLAVQPAG